MKKKWKILLVLVVLALIIITLAGIASAQEVNLARPANGGSASVVHNSIDDAHWRGSASQLNDGSTSGWVGYEDDNSASSSSSADMYAIITLDSASTVNRIRYRSYAAYNPFADQTNRIYLEYYDGSWHRIDSRVSGSSELPASTRTEYGPYNGVTRVRVHLNSYSSGCGYDVCYVEAGVSEIEVWGEACTLLTCADNYIGECGSALDDGCGGTLDCSNNCGANEICESEVCVPTQITKTCGNNDNIIMKLFSPTNSHGAIWNFGGSTALEGCNPDSGTNEDCQSCGQIFDPKPIQAWTYSNYPPTTPGCYNVDDAVLNSSAFYCDNYLGEGYFSCAANKFAFVDNWPDPSSAGWYVCPSYERNGNVPVTANDCICYDVNFNHCDNPPVTYDEAFNFSNEYFSGQTYDYEICYSDFFNDGYENLGLSEQEYHPTSCSNPILWLNNIYNSHASTDEISTYILPVCYGDLSCYDVNVSAGEDCDFVGGEEVVVSLYQKTNSHISNASDANYPIKICCKRGTIIPPTQRYWANMKEEPITTADMGDTVKMIYSGVSQTYDFDIWEDDVTFGFPHDDKIKSNMPSFLKNGKAIAKWTINTEEFEEQTNDYDHFFFEVDSENSDYLNVSKDSYDNSVPKAKIIEPVEGSSYIIRSNGKTGTIDFIQEVEDEDDDLKALWNFDYNSDSGWLENCLTTGNCNTNYSYETSGTKDVTLQAQEMTRKQTAKDTSRIYVYRQGINVFVVLDKKIQGKSVFLNASKSFVADCYNTSGECEASPTDAKTGCYEVNDSDDDSVKLYCYNKNIRYKGDASEINARLIFGLNGVVFQPREIEDFVFFAALDSPGEHVIELNMGYKKE